MRSLETLLSNPSIPALCVYWHADRIEKSHSVLNALASILPSCLSVRLVVVSTNQFPQLKFKYSAKQLSIQCYWKGELELTGSDEKDMMEFERRVEKRERMVLMGLEEESEESENKNEMCAIEEETFGMVGVTDAMKREMNDVIETLAKECGNETKMKQAIDVALNGAGHE